MSGLMIYKVTFVYIIIYTEAFKPVVPKLFLRVAPWLMVNPSRGPPALKQVTSSRIEKNHKNLAISTMNVQANLSIIICYILMGKKFKKIPGNSPMAPSLGTTDLNNTTVMVLKWEGVDQRC